MSKSINVQANKPITKNNNGTAAHRQETPSSQNDLYSVQNYTHNDNICAHLYQTGFLNGNFHDVEFVLTMQDLSKKTFRLHKLLLSQSKYFLRKLLILANDNESAVSGSVVDPSLNRYKLELDLNEYFGLLTEEAIAYSIAFMYNQFPIKLLNDKNAFDVFIASIILELDVLSEKSYAYLTMRTETLSSGQIGVMVDRLQTISSYYNSSSNKKEMPELVEKYIEYGKAMLISKTNVELANQSILDNSEVISKFDYLIELPFSWFKELLESTQLNITHMERFKLSKIIINRRNQIKNTTSKGESVIMAFGSSSSNLNNSTKSRINILPGEPQTVDLRKNSTET